MSRAIKLDKSKFYRFRRLRAENGREVVVGSAAARCSANAKARSAFSPVSVGVSLLARLILSPMPHQLPAGSSLTIIPALTFHEGVASLRTM